MEYFNLAREALFKKQYQKAFEYYSLGSNNDPSCLFGLGLCYKKGYFLKRNDMKAEEIFESAMPKLLMNVSVDDATNSLVLYFMYSEGYGCNKDLSKAKMFLEIAKEAGNIEAAFIDAGLDGSLAYASTNELVVALKDEKDINKLKSIYQHIDKFDSESPLKYTLDAIILDFKIRLPSSNSKTAQAVSSQEDSNAKMYI